MKSVNSSLDWSEVESEIGILSRQLPAFSKDFLKIKNNLHIDFRELSKIEVEIRRTKNKNIELKKHRLLIKINSSLDTIQQIHLLGVLSK